MAKVKTHRQNKRHTKQMSKDSTKTVEQDAVKLESSLIRTTMTTWMGRTTICVPVIAALLVWPMLHKNERLPPSNISSSNSNWNKSSNAYLQQHQRKVAAACNLVMAESTIPNGGWGMFTLQDLQPGSSQLGEGDVVIPVPDLQQHHLQLGLELLLRSYMWSSEITGGATEGTVVYSVLPSFGMLANGNSRLYSIVPHQARQHHGGTPRNKSPGAGASSYYHNFSFVPSKAILAGEEIFLDYGRGWDSKIPNTEATRRSKAWLREHGMCVDHLRPGLSTIPHAGHGAFASRFLPKGTIVAPAPLLPIAHRHSLQFMSKDGSQRNQLLLNYCFGHPNSTLLLFPYSPMVTLINHSSEKPNAMLRWSARETRVESMTLDDVSKTTGLLMEVVATRDIQEGEEVLIDYGDNWEQAWQTHAANWQRHMLGFSDYTYAHEMNAAQRVILTETEQQHSPYPANLETSCYFYRDRAVVQSSIPHQSDGMDMLTTTTFQWHHHSALFHPSKLRPCRVLERIDGSGGKQHSYTVGIGNRQGLAKGDAVPSNEQWLVHNVPRAGIQFTDVPYSSDQYLTSAFRHEIGIPNGQFPTHWMDMN